ncbi:nucleotide-binding universal stress UspA family protein [Pseudoduganella flava]|uniref:Nucleotide-binding universal stress UspA family protein n=1 Tax=Pseudoduganella flava TaxID=871742 RepID=A0A562PLF3_9BURK|nr:universal stress protein [Pseudoduganella flava]QGZ42460.1 universal stress protein [Pseudoduganella flava]TWI45030.1 nucleotide-binding universal stress UspA family protein [Pseudoduganella flava]
MSYKTILVHVDLSEQAPRRIGTAARLALEFDAHLTGVASTGLSNFIHPGTAELSGGLLAARYDELIADAQTGLDRFEALVQHAGVPSFERRLASDDIDGGLALHARYCDLSVFTQADPAGGPLASHDLPEYVVLNAARPVLLLPRAGHADVFGTNALIAWDGSHEATRAVAFALPLLKRARRTVVAVLDPWRGNAHGDQPGADLALYLSRHGIAVEVRVQLGRVDRGDALLTLAADQGADLLVMGGYGHARARELLLGGVTKTILRSMTVPVLMAH